MKRLVALVAVLAVVITAVALVRTLIISAPPVPARLAVETGGTDPMIAANHLAEAVRFQTVSYGEGVKEAEKNAALEQLHAWMEQTYPAFHKAASREIIGESLLFTWKGSNAALPPMLMMAHMDVVPVVPGTEKDWTHPPFSGDMADGFVWGRGTIDDKGSLVAILEAADALAASGFTPQRTILFAFGQDEEVGGGKGNAVIAKTLAMRGMRLANVLDEGPPIMNEPYAGVHRPIAFVATAEKGYLSLALTAHGLGGHSARPSRDLALVRLADAIRNVMRHPFVSDLDDIQQAKFAVLAPYVPLRDRLMLANLWLTRPLVVRDMDAQAEAAASLHTTISPTMLEAGVKENVIPPVARAVINFRLHPRDTIASVTDHVKDAIADPKVDVEQLTETRSEASKSVDLNGPAYRALADAIGASLGIPVAPEIMTGATDSRHYLAIADSVLRFRPFTAELTDLARVHGTNERVAIADLAPAIAFYRRLMENAK